MDRAEAIQVELVRSLRQRHTELRSLSLPAGSTVQTALQTLEWPVDGLMVALWGKPVALSHVLQHRDRIELCRPLCVDPKEARRLRYQKQGRRTTQSSKPPRKTPG
jgi:uncharacterized protein